MKESKKRRKKKIAENPTPLQSKSIVFSSLPGDERLALNACMVRLIGLLQERKDGISVMEVLLRGKREGYGRLTIFRARKALRDRIYNTCEWNNSLNRWKLKG
jgi:hypothetical protein